MNLRNLQIRKRVISVIVAMGFSLCPSHSLADIISYNSDGAKLTNGSEVKLFFTTGNTDDDYAFVSFGKQVGFIYNRDVNYYDFCSNNYYVEQRGDMYINSNETYLYQSPNFNQDNNNVKLELDSKVHLIAKNNDGWCVVVTDNNQTGFVHQSLLRTNEQRNLLVLPPEKKETTEYAKITGNNVNIRSTNSTKSTVIGFADKTDYFKILGYDGTWYQIDYLGNIGYISGEYVKKIDLAEENRTYQKVVYMKEDTYFYQDLGNNYMSILPRYQSASVIKEVQDYYQVVIDGVIGFVKKNKTKTLSDRCIVVDLSRQILKVYYKGNEVYRAKIISGRSSMQTNIGCFKIGHRNRNYTFKSSGIFNEYWLQFNNNIGLHPADANNGKGWQKKKYFEENVDNAYNNWSKGVGKTYPKEHGSHGCVNMQIKDIEIIYDLVRVDDNVLVIGPNNLVRDNLISYQGTYHQEQEHERVKKLTYNG